MTKKKALTDKKPSPRLRLRTDKGDGVVVEVESSLEKLIGTDDESFAEGLVNQLVNVGTQGKLTDLEGPNFMLSVIKGIEPRDQVEAMLASQMAAVQMATMTFARRLAHTETIVQQESAMRGFTKLTRCFTSQVEALKKYRSNGQQKVTVEHVTVNDGGQAIVGHVDQGGRGGEKN